MSDLGNKEIMAQNIQHYMDEWGVSRKELANKLGLANMKEVSHFLYFVDSWITISLKPTS